MDSKLALPQEKEFNHQNVNETVTFGPVHLNNTSIEKAIFFWTKVIGMRLKSQSAKVAEFGTAIKTLVIVHQTATSAFKEGYSGIYHFGIHLPNMEEFAKAMYRLQSNDYMFSAIDHTMSLSLYLKDYDNIMIELALETPERFKRIITEGGLFIENIDGTIKSVSAPLFEEDVSMSLIDKDLSKHLSDEAKIGQLHFYVKDLALQNSFYKRVGFTQFHYLPYFKYADLGAGGEYKHRMAINSWHGTNVPLAPDNHAGLRHYEIVFECKEQLRTALNDLGETVQKDGKYWIKDPTGITTVLSVV